MIDGRILNLIPQYSDYSDTYDTDYGRVAGWVKAEATAEKLADVVDWYRRVRRLAKTSAGSRIWRMACKTYREHAAQYAEMTGMTKAQVSEKARVIAECFDN